MVVDFVPKRRTRKHVAEAVKLTNDARSVAICRCGWAYLVPVQMLVTSFEHIFLAHTEERHQGRRTGGT